MNERPQGSEEAARLKAELGQEQHRRQELAAALAEREARLAELQRSLDEQAGRMTSLLAERAKAVVDLAETEARLAGLMADPLWRGLGPLRWLRQRLDPYLPRTVKSFRLIPECDLEKAAEGPGSWVATGPDPHFRLVPVDGRLPSGWVLLDTTVRRETSDYTLKLYLDSGEGFSEKQAVVLPVSLKGRVHELVELPRGVKGLRWDPMQAPGKIDQGPIRFSRVGLLRRVWRRYRRVVPMMWGQPEAKRRRHGLSWSKVFFDLDGAYAAAGRLRNAFSGDVRQTYEAWIQRYDTLTEELRERMRQEIAGLQRKPLISILMPVYNTPEAYLREAIDSVRGQLYERWELCVADDASPKPHVKAVLEEYRAQDPRIKVTYRAENGHISAASNSALSLATGEFVALLDHDDRLAEHALYYVARAINEHADARVLYSDEDKIDDRGGRFDPHFKSDWNPDLLLSQNYVSHLGVYATDRVREVGGFRVGYEGSQDYDLLLRCAVGLKPEDIVHIPHVLYHWRALEGSTALRHDEKSYTQRASINALKDLLDREGHGVGIEPGLAPNTFHVRWPIPDPPPLVSLLIPTRDGLNVLAKCVESILNKTIYRNYEIVILDNQSRQPETLRWFEDIKKRKRVRVVPYDFPFNFSAINNFGVAQARGDIVGLINNDIEVISPGWLSEMVSHACRPEIGCVGAKLYYDDDRIQHAGVILGIGGVAGHSHKYFPRDSFGYFSRLMIVQNLSAVTAACLLVRKTVYVAAGGLNEKDLSVAFNDVDFCLRVQEMGLRNLWTPYAELYHHESVTRGAEDSPEKVARFRAEIAYMNQRWGSMLQEDFAYSRNLTLDHEDFSIAN